MASLTTPPGGTPTVKWRFPKVHPEAYKFLAIAALLTFFFAEMSWETLAWPMGAVTIWVAAFFRDPVRAVPQGTGLIVAPADGLITMIETVAPPRELVGEGALPPEPLVRISTFMSVFDVHINRAPIGGTIRRVVYVSGRFLNASLDKASEENERQHFLIEGFDGTRIGFTQIAGLVARRILPFTKAGDIVVAGQRVGLIRFGSRVDVYLPAGTAPTVVLGQRAIAGETILARLGADERMFGTPL